MRIALVTPEYITEHTFDGGLANYTHRLALALRDMRHEPVVLVPHDHDEAFDHEGIPVHRVQTWHPPLQWTRAYSYVDAFDRLTGKRFHMALNLWWRSMRLNRAVACLHRERPFDVVHYAHLGGLGRLRSQRLPVVTRLSSATRLCQEFGGYGKQNAQIEQQIRFETAALKKSDRLFGPSECIATMLSAELRRPISVIETPFLVDAHTLNDDLYREHGAGKKYLLFFGSVCLIKGVETLVQIIRPLLERHPDLHFLFIGKKVPGQKGGDLMARVFEAAGPYADRITWLPSQQHDRLFPFIQHAHAVILPSLTDNFPNACIEAMAFGRVVVGTKGNGFEQLIDDGASGFLCNPGNPGDLLTAVERVLFLSDEEHAVMGTAAAKRIERLRPEHTVPQVLDEYLAAAEAHR